MVSTLLDLLANELFHCPINRLEERLAHPMLQAKANAYLAGKWVRTLYLRDRRNKLLKVGGLTQMGADRLVAYEGYLSVTVRQHFYSRHKIRLLYPLLPCVVVYGKLGHNSYYPLELLTLAREASLGKEGGREEGAESAPLVPALCKEGKEESEHMPKIAQCW
jgi:hypothetical protein